jgi:hypothetical protein
MINFECEKTGPIQSLQMPVLIREFIDGYTLSQLIRDNALTDAHLFELGVVFGELLDFAAKKVLPANLQPEHIVFTETARGIRARICNVSQAAEGLEELLGYLKHNLTPSLLRYGIDPGPAKLVAEGLRAALPQRSITSILPEFRKELASVAEQLTNIGSLEPYEKIDKAQTIKEIETLQILLQTIST